MKISFLGTGAGNSTRRAHTAIAVECPDGARFLLDASSGNSVLRNGNSLGLDLRSFNDVLLSHDHPDHMSGISFIQFHRTLSSEDVVPIRVHSSHEALEGLKRYCLGTRLNVNDVSGGYGRTPQGREVLEWKPAAAGQPVRLGPQTTAWHFPANHITGAVGWRVECAGSAIVFSGDTRYSPELVNAAAGADLLVHEAFSVGDPAFARAFGHCTGGEAGQAAMEARVSRLALTHITDPYHEATYRLGDEAAGPFDGPIELAHDLLQLDL